MYSDNIIKENFKDFYDNIKPLIGGGGGSVINADGELPILFDETGKEYQVGWYKRASDGKVKPIYKCSYIGDLTNLNNERRFSTIADFSNKEFIGVDTNVSYVYDNADKNYYPVLSRTGTDVVGVAICLFVSASSTPTLILLTQIISNCTYHLTVSYTKTTDSWKEV